MKNLNKTTKTDFATYIGVTVVFVVVLLLKNAGVLTRSLSGQLVPICCYIVMAISLNLTVGILGELSLGHAGFMSVGAFMGTTAAVSLQGVIASAPLRLAIAMVIGAIFAAIVGFLIGIPVLRLRGDYLAIVTLAFGEIILTATATTSASCRHRKTWKRAESLSSAGRWASAACRRSPRSPAASSS